ncbi:MAG: hypothetical protein IJ744_08570 [Lachnospiraceae bacterium]|nr:hypothetical protein [Lachnospiraceae bacterium]
MIAVLLTILKVIGIILLVILGLILLILLLVLFVPFRYQVKADGEDKTWAARAKVGWLGYLLQANVIFEEMKLQILAKAFGIKVFDSGAKPLGKQAKQEEKEEPKETKAEEEKAEETAEEEKVEVEKTEEKGESSEETALNASMEEEVTEEIVLGTEPVEEPDADVFSDFGAHTDVTLGATEEAGEKQSEKHESISLWNRLDSIYETIDGILDKVEPILEFLQEDDTKDLFGGFFGTIGRIFKHILPNRLSGDLRVGTGDPVDTAKIVAVMSLLYPKLPEKFHFEGYFIDKKIAADDLTISGRIRIGSMVGMLIGLVLKGYTLRTIKRVKALLKTLKEQPQEG